MVVGRDEKYTRDDGGNCADHPGGGGRSEEVAVFECRRAVAEGVEAFGGSVDTEPRAIKNSCCGLDPMRNVDTSFSGSALSIGCQPGICIERFDLVEQETNCGFITGISD